MICSTVILVFSASLSLCFALKSGPPRFKLRDILSNSYFSLSIGGLGYFSLLLNRLSIPFEDVTDIQSRSDILSVVSCSAIVLNALSSLDISTRQRDEVSLFGQYLKEPDIGNTVDALGASTKWLIDSILSRGPVKSVCVFYGADDVKLIGRGGVVGFNGPILSKSVDTLNKIFLDKVTKRKEFIDIPDLQILPGKIEFDYLPLNAQSVCMFPLKKANGAVVVATCQALSMKAKEIADVRELVYLYDQLI